MCVSLCCKVCRKITNEVRGLILRQKQGRKMQRRERDRDRETKTEEGKLRRVFHFVMACESTLTVK
jgi:hypothetical protein